MAVIKNVDLIAKSKLLSLIYFFPSAHINKLYEVHVSAIKEKRYSTKKAGQTKDTTNEID